MSRLDCERAGPLIDAFRDGLLDGAERELVSAHLNGCSVCAAEEADLSSLLRADRLFPDHGIDAAALARRGPWSEAPIVKVHAWRRRAAALVAVAAAVVVGAAVALHARESANEPRLFGVNQGVRAHPQVRADDQKPRPVGLEIVSAESVTLATSATNTADQRGR